MADIKALLKEARKLIDDKNFKEAQECCKSILRKDKQNYFGLVLLGKSLQDSDQAPLAYRKAIECKPELPLAWQGLANYYETKDDDSSKRILFTIYKELLKLKMENDKTLDVLTRLCALGKTLRKSEAITILSEFMDEDHDQSLSKAADEQFINLLKTDLPIEQNDIDTILGTINRLSGSDPNDELQLIHCKILLQKSDYFSAVEEIINLPFFVKNVIVREWLCKQLCIKYVENMSFEGFKIEEYIELITDNVVNSKFPSLLRSMIFFDKGDFINAYKLCVPLINYQDPESVEAIFIIKCTIMLKKWPIAQKLANNFLTKVKDDKLACELHKFLFIALVKQQKWKDAISSSKNIPIDLMTTREKALLATCYIEIDAPSETIVEHLSSTEYHMQLQAQLLLKQQRYEDTINLLQNAQDDATTAFYLGKAYWELKQYEKCLINLLKSAKLNPEHSDTFLYLGHFYYYLKDDLEKAKKCYEKAYSLNNFDYNIAKSLSEVYITLKQNDSNFELLSNLAKDMSRNETWVFFRLGLHYLNQKEWENAIINLRNVIKMNSRESTAFECLADAYYGRGSFTSALKAYDRVMSIDPKKTAHCLTRIGYIYSLLTQYEEAIGTFEKVLNLDPHSFLALKGISETWMRIAKKKLASKIYGSARDCAQNAVNYIIIALTKQNHFPCFWKLLGDILMFIIELPKKYAYVYMHQLTKDLNSEAIAVRKERLEIYPEAIACYSYITKQHQQIASYDLAYAYFSYYNETKKDINGQIAFNLVLTCIKEKPLLWHNWNLLGKICMVIKKYELAQHCFIKALLITKKCSVAKIWCNLGILYLKLQLYKLANYCFSRGQSSLPSYPQSWIGQGLIAEAIREEEAMDLFRHASRLGYHPESALGYGDWVCRTLKINKYNEDAELKYVIEGLYAVPYATDLLEWFCNYDSENACAYTILGILQERGGLINSAIESYRKALQYSDESKKNIALLNIGRILNRTGRYDAAIKVYKAITEASLNSAAGLALALSKKGLYEEAYSAYNTALHWLSDDDNEKSDLLVAMAGAVYKFKGVDEAKTLLFHSIQISQKRPNANSLFALCSLGLLQSDNSLSKLALSELKKYDKEIDYGFDIGFLKSFLLISDQNMEQAFKLLSDSIHDHPNNPLLWFCMAQYCLIDNNIRAKIASRCAQKALCSARTAKDFGNNCNFAKIIATASAAEHIAGDAIKALLLAKEGLHMFPSQVEIWAALLRSLLSHKEFLERKTWILGMIEHIRKHLNASRRLVKWITIIEKKLCR